MEKEQFIKENMEDIYFETLRFMFLKVPGPEDRLIVDEVRGDVVFVTIKNPMGEMERSLICPGESDMEIKMNIRHGLVWSMLASVNPSMAIAAELNEMMQGYGWLDRELSFANVIVLKAIEGVLAAFLKEKKDDSQQPSINQVVRKVANVLQIESLVKSIAQRQALIAQVGAAKTKKRH